MSYRTYINDTKIQLFGNDETYEEWIQFIMSQGIKVDDKCYYSGEIHDFMKALEVIEAITLRLNEERKLRNQIRNISDKNGIFDFSKIPEQIIEEKKFGDFNTSLFDRLNDTLKNSYAFLPYQFFKACEDKLIEKKPFTIPGHFHCYELKPGETIHVEAR